MQNINTLCTVATAVLCCLGGSCASTNAPKDWLTEPGRTGLDGYGGWVDVRASQGRISGELIAVTEDTVFIADTVLHTVTTKDILSARLVTYDAGGLGGLVLLGTLSTLSNGWFLVFSAPIWLIGGTIAAISRSYDPIINYPQKPLEDFRPFARCPQGFPPGLDRHAITMKVKKKG